jgi:hypothetical protein
VCRTLRHYIARDQNFKPSIFHGLGFRPFTATTKNGEAFCQYGPKNYYDFEIHEDILSRDASLYVTLGASNSE